MERASIEIHKKALIYRRNPKHDGPKMITSLVSFVLDLCNDVKSSAIVKEGFALTNTSRGSFGCFDVTTRSAIGHGKYIHLPEHSSIATATVGTTPKQSIIQSAILT